jgi:multidrug resistance efflux pump
MNEIVEQPKARRRRRRPSLRALIALAVAAVLVGWAVMAVAARRTRGPDLSAVETAQVERGDLIETIGATGVVTGETGARLRIGSQITGRIKRLYVDVGQPVKAGQLIAELDLPDVKAQRDSAQRALDQAQARYDQQLAGVGIQHADVVTAYEQAEEQVRAAEAGVQSGQASVSAADGRVKAAEAALQSARARQTSADARLAQAKASAELQPTQTTAAISQADAALGTAKARLKQTEKGVALEIAAAEAAVRQAAANAELAASDLKRQEQLYSKGYVAGATVEAARTQQRVTAEQLNSANSSLTLTQEKTEADLQAAKDVVTQAEAALVAAKAGRLQDTVAQQEVASAEGALDDAKHAVNHAAAQLASAKADVGAAQAQLDQARSQVAQAKASREAALANLAQDKVKQQEVRAAYSALQQAREQVKIAEAQWQKTFIRTPIPGTVLKLSQQEGETVAAGLSAPTLVEVGDLSRLEVTAYVDETDVGRVEVGQQAEITVDAYVDRTFKGRVTKMASGPTEQQGVITYETTITLDKYPPGMLRPGMTADVRIAVQEKRNVLRIPTEAVKQLPRGERAPGQDWHQ